MSKPFVAILMGSVSDLPTVQPAVDILRQFDIPFEAKVTSAHRTPERTHEYVRDAERRGCVVFIAAAGMAAHLAGTVAGLVVKPVIGIPISAGPLQGVDALLSTVQMPGGVPVATVAIGKAGAKNAGYLAAQILAVSDPNLAERIASERRDNAEAFAAADARLMDQLGQG